MAKQKKKRGRKAVGAAAVVALLLFAFNGDLSLDFFGGEGEEDQEPTQEVNQEEEFSGQVTLTIDGDQLFLGNGTISFENLEEALRDVEIVVLQGENAKLVMYEEVKTKLQDLDIVIIEE